MSKQSTKGHETINSEGLFQLEEPHGRSLQDIEKSLYTGFIDKAYPSTTSLRPRLIINNREKHQKVLLAIQGELSSCTQFDIAVAFITRDGIASLLQTLLEASQRGVRGRLLTTNYLHFNEPEALETLLDLPNLEVRILEGNLHTKGYLFHHAHKTINLVVGSANLTAQALSTNQEWNVQFTSTENGELVHQTYADFNRMWESAIILSPAYLMHYEKEREVARTTAQWTELPPVPQPRFPVYEEVTQEGELIPNTMQAEALQELFALRHRGETKGLIISATGTGKTHLAAFDAKACNPRKLLYIVHRQTILLKSMATFQHVFGRNEHISFGVVGGGRRETECNFIFASISTLAREDVLSQFAREHFDYIIVDEVHRAGAESYKKVLDYFNSKFTLGMTATPERTDGQDIYRLFDYNIAYNIRLQAAMEAKLLCQFHYYGISDLTIDGLSVDDSSDTRFLTSIARSRHIKEAIDTYSMHEKRKRGLIFCRTVVEAKELSERLNTLGLKTLAVTGEDSETVREDAIQRLQSDRRPDMLEYLVSVDIFNEGIDIPNLNQIIMARPTQSAIIFVQQLGRGLRKAKGKPFVTVIDFVGNYDNNYLIPIALYGDTSFNKDRMRKMMVAGNLVLNGESTVSFDRIARQRIFRAIDDARLDTKALFKEQYLKLKARLGQVPSLMDFAIAKEYDPLLFFKKYDSYPALLMGFGELPRETLTKTELCSLRFLSQELANGKRPHELLVLKLLAKHGSISITLLQSILEQDYHFIFEQQAFQSTIRLLNNGFVKQAARDSYDNLVYVRMQDDGISASPQFLALLASESYRNAFNDVIALGLYNYRTHYDNQLRQPNSLVLYEKYSRKDVCRLLNWEDNEDSTMYGYKIKYNTCPIFVTYHKGEEISASTDYDDKFLSPELFSWMTRSKRTLDSGEVRKILSQHESGLSIPLFIKKHDDEGADFYYIGQAEYIKGRERQTTIKDEAGKDLPIVNFLFKLQQPCENDLYTYLLEQAQQ